MVNDLRKEFGIGLLFFYHGVKLHPLNNRDQQRFNKSRYSPAYKSACAKFLAALNKRHEYKGGNGKYRRACRQQVIRFFKRNPMLVHEKPTIEFVPAKSTVSESLAKKPRKLFGKTVWNRATQAEAIRVKSSDNIQPSRKSRTRRSGKKPKGIKVPLNRQTSTSSRNSARNEIIRTTSGSRRRAVLGIEGITLLTLTLANSVLVLGVDIINALANMGYVIGDRFSSLFGFSSETHFAVRLMSHFVTNEGYGTLAQEYMDFIDSFSGAVVVACHLNILNSTNIPLSIAEFEEAITRFMGNLGISTRYDLNDIISKSNDYFQGRFYLITVQGHAFDRLGFCKFVSSNLRRLLIKYDLKKITISGLNTILALPFVRLAPALVDVTRTVADAGRVTFFRNRSELIIGYPGMANNVRSRTYRALESLDNSSWALNQLDGEESLNLICQGISAVLTRVTSVVVGKSDIDDYIEELESSIQEL